MFSCGPPLSLMYCSPVDICLHSRALPIFCYHAWCVRARRPCANWVACPEWYADLFREAGVRWLFILFLFSSLYLMDIQKLMQLFGLFIAGSMLAFPVHSTLRTVAAISIHRSRPRYLLHILVETQHGVLLGLAISSYPAFWDCITMGKRRARSEKSGFLRISNPWV